MTADQLKNLGVGCKSQENTQVIPLRARSAGAVRENRNIRMEHLCSSEWGMDLLQEESQRDQITCQECTQTKEKWRTQKHSIQKPWAYWGFIACSQARKKKGIKGL